MYDGPDNTDRAARAEAALQTLGTLARRTTWPHSETGQAAKLAALARVALATFAAQSRSGGVNLGGVPPMDDATEAEKAAYAEELEEIAEIASDFLGDLRHLLDRYGLTVDAVCLAPPTSHVDDDTATVHVLAAMAVTGLNIYTTAAGLDFFELDGRGARHHQVETAEQAADARAELERQADALAIEAAADEIAAATTDEIGRAAHALGQNPHQQSPGHDPHQ